MCEFYWNYLSHFLIVWDFSPLPSQLLTLCDTSCQILCEILILYWMIMKFYMCILDTLSFALVLIPFISHLFSFSYDFLKLTHVWLTSLSMVKIVLTSWFSLTIFPWSKWAEILYACHVMDCDWSWIIWWFLELIMIGFELSLAVDFYELSFAMFWLLLLIKSWWWMICMWEQLSLLLDCLNLILVDFHLLFWLLSFIFDPRLALVVSWLMLSSFVSG
jgi:hypothetical protein